MKRSKVLTITSIILIISGIFGILAGVPALLNLDVVNQALVEAGMNTVPAWTYIFSILCAVVAFAAGIIGVRFRSVELVKVIGLVNIAFTVVSIIIGIVISSASISSVLNLVIPALYMWGWAKSK